MRTRFLVPVLTAGLLSLTGCDIEDLNTGHFTSDFHQSQPLHAGGKVSVESFNGAIEVSTWDQPTVDITATKYGPTQQAADDLEVRVDHSGDSVSVRAVRPSIRRGNQGAKFLLRVPEGAAIDRLVSSNGGIRVTHGSGPAHLQTSNGSIHVIGFDGSLDAQSSNGSITAELTHATGPIRTETSNGSIALTLPADFRDDVRAHSSNGGITVHLPHDMNARISARTSNAKITSDFDLRMQGELGRNHLDGVMGSGGPLVELSTSNGSIHLAR
jgi:Putative adhesin